MYKVYCDSTLIHNAASPDAAYHLIDPVLNLEDSAAGSFTFKMAPGSKGYNIVTRMVSTIKVYKDGDNRPLWTGRVLTESEDFWKCRTCTCEGALAFLNDSIQELHTYTNTDLLNFLQTLINNHNAKVANNRKINLGAVTVNDMNDSHVYTTAYQNTLTVIQSEIFDRLGGHLRIRYVANDDIPRLDYLSTYPTTAVQTINFGKNLLNFTKDWDLSDLVTVILPRGAQLETEDEYGNYDYVNVSTVNNNSKYVVSTNAYNTFGRIEGVVDFPDIETPAALLTIANTYLSALQFDTMTLTISAVDLHNIDSSITPFKLLDEVRCISLPHGMDAMFPIAAIEIPLDKPESVTYTMGKVAATLTTKTAESNHKVLTQIANMPSFTNLLDTAKANATEIMNQATTGYVTIVQEDDMSQALIISNTPNYLNATKLWRFNMNGLGYMDTNISDNYSLAITMDGTIVADFIKTGILSDGYGLNYWNLSTGEFTLAYNTEFATANGGSITMGDVATLAYNANVSANNAGLMAADAYYGASGGDNLLKGVSDNHALLNGSNQSSWDNGTWDALEGPGGSQNISKYVMAATDSSTPKKPHAEVPTIDVFKNNTNTSYISAGTITYITQRAVPVVNDTVYTVSCYACWNPLNSTGLSEKPRLAILVGDQSYYLTNQARCAYATEELEAMSSVNDINKPGKWRRYSLTFKVVSDSDSSEAESSHLITIAKNNNLNVLFGAMLSARSVVYISGLKLERGNIASDWSSTSDDVKTISIQVSNGYSDSVKQTAITYTDRNIADTRNALNTRINQAYNDSTNYTNQAKTYLKNYFNDTEILNRLTNNGARKGIFMQNGQLYINATYLKSGSLDANLLRVGIIRDTIGHNSWNLMTGAFYSDNIVTENMRATNAEILGTFWAVDSTRSGGSVLAVWNNRIVSLPASSSTNNIKCEINFAPATGSLMVNAEGSLFLTGRDIYVSSPMSRSGSGAYAPWPANAERGYTGTISIPSISNFRYDTSSNSWKWTTTQYNIRVVKGLIVGITRGF